MVNNNLEGSYSKGLEEKFKNTPTEAILREQLTHMKGDIFPEFLEQFCDRVDDIMKGIPEKVAKDERVIESITEEAKKLTRHANLGSLKQSMVMNDAANDPDFSAAA